jgi:CHAD domain-containing protein
VQLVRRYLEEKRRYRHDKVAHTLANVSVSRLRKRIREVGVFAADFPEGKLAPRLRARVAKRERDLAAAIDRAGAVYDIDKLHAVRIAVKKLRYTLELAQDVFGRKWTRRIAVLKAQQGLLGNLHDLQVLVRHIRTLEGSLVSHRGPLADAMSVIRRDLDAESRRLHGAWLKHAKKGL